MGGFIALALMLLLFAGAIGIWTRILDAFRGVSKATPRHRSQERSNGSSPHIHTFIQALENEGYMGRAALSVEDMEYVDDPVLADMLATIAKECDLKWALPPHRLRLKAVPEDAPEEFKGKYKWVVMTPTHVIGYK